MNQFGHNSTSQSGPRIYNPWLDLIAGCGAWSTPLLLLSYSTMASSARTWSGFFYVLALFFNSPHSMATGYRAYHRTGGRVLDHVGFSPKLAYAGMVKAQVEARSVTNPADPTAIEGCSAPARKQPRCNRGGSLP